VLVRDLFRGSPAQRAGIKRGDIIQALGGDRINSLSDYRGLLSEYAPGNSVEIRLFRDGEVEKIKVELEAFPVDLALDLVERRLGLRVAEAGPSLRHRYGLEKAVAIKEVKPGTKADEAGLEPGDLILKINKEETPDLEAFKRAVSRYHQLPSLTLFVRRGAYVYSLTLPF
jgi:serine protease Do